jgi:hypothetical protein
MLITKDSTAAIHDVVALEPALGSPGTSLPDDVAGAMTMLILMPLQQHLATHEAQQQLCACKCCENAL